MPGTGQNRVTTDVKHLPQLDSAQYQIYAKFGDADASQQAVGRFLERLPHYTLVLCLQIHL